MIFVSLFAYALLAQTPTPPPATIAPAISKAAEAGYWKALAVHNALDAHFKGSLTADQKATQEALDKQEHDIDAAAGAISAECGEKFQLDREQFKKGVFACIAKPEPVKPAK